MSRTLRRWFCAVILLSLGTPFLWLVQVQQGTQGVNDVFTYLTLRPDAIDNKVNRKTAVYETMNSTKSQSVSYISNAGPRVWMVTIGTASRNSTVGTKTTTPRQGDPCRKRYVTHASDVAPNPVKTRILFMDGVGRLGNKMFQYAALLGIAKRQGFTPLVNRRDLVVNVFEISHVTDTKYTKLPVYFEKAAAMYDPCLETMRPDWDWRLGGYYQSWKYFTNVEDEVRKEFTFKEFIRKKVSKHLNDIELKFKGHTKVGVHIRRGDMSVAPSRKKGYTMADRRYFLKAMNYFRKTLKDPVFVVLSDDINWCRRELKNQKDVMFFHGTRESDLATLASCNHSIISTGTYGWWGAWLAGGRTVYYKNFPLNGSWLATQYKADDYFPPSWIGME